MINFWLFGAIFLFLYFCNYYKNWKFYKASEKFPGPMPFPLLGNSLNFAKDSHGIFIKIVELSKKYGRFFRVWNNGKLFLICNNGMDVEAILSSNVHLHKNDSYRFLYDWIGDGLISTSNIPLWRKHRKIITPTFHFKILNDFMEVFNRNAIILCDLLKEKGNKEPFDVHAYIKLEALDNICETAMGTNMSIQRNSDSTYVKAVQTIGAVVCLRIFKVWLMIDALFNITKYAKFQKKALNVLHGTTDQLISDAREKFRKKSEGGDNFEFSYEKKKLAFLNLLLESEEGFQLSDKEIREEVATFMFAGHDTISSGMSFALYCLADNPDIQEKAYKEQLDIIGDSTRYPTFSEVQEMKYLERIIKEVERLYPSVPLIARELHEDLKLPEDYIVPKGTQIVINMYSLHRDPTIWKNPETFNPDNFLPEATQSRNPYAFVPFSAGARNCIGQKYAMLAMKITLSAILRQYQILPSPFPKDKPILATELVLISKNGINIRVKARH